MPRVGEGVIKGLPEKVFFRLRLRSDLGEEVRRRIFQKQGMAWMEDPMWGKACCNKQVKRWFD